MDNSQTKNLIKIQPQSPSGTVNLPNENKIKINTDNVTI